VVKNINKFIYSRFSTALRLDLANKDQEAENAANNALQKAKMEQIRTMVLANCLTIPGIKPGQ
jgi:hypothetical protein